MSEVIGAAAEVTPEWLTKKLRQDGILEHGRVTNVRLKSSRTLPVSIVSYLEISLSSDASASVPKHLFLKITNPDFEPDAPRETPPPEVEFYLRVAGLMPDSPAPRCFDAAFSHETGRAHLILEDLSETHYHPPVPLPPTSGECEMAADCLARVHAYWWEHKQLGKEVGQLLNAERVNDLAQEAAARFVAFADFMGDRLSQQRRRICERVISIFPQPWVQLTAVKGLTLTHGDAHTYNFLYPRRSLADRIYLLDWQLWHPHIGPRDLAFMMTLFWYPERRMRMERALLRRYHRGLLAGGVERYSWDDCWNDYRWSALRNIFIPLWHWSRGMAAGLWWSQWERAILAFEDLNCIELVEN